MVRRIGLALLCALALIFLLIAAALGLAQTGFGKRMIASELSALLSTPEMAVEIRGLQGIVPIDMGIGRITAADAHGVWLEVDDLRLAWSPGALLGGRVRIDALTAARIGVDRLPPSEPSPEPAEPIRMPELPEWLPPTTLQQLSVAKLDLGQAVLGEPASFALSGHLDMPDDGTGANLALDLERTDEPTARAAVDATLQFEPATLDLTMRAQENGGLLAALTGRPEATGFALELSGKGPLDAWKGTLQANAEGLGKADATLGIALADQLALSVDGEIVPAPGLLPADVAALLGDQLGLALSVVQTGPQQLRIERFRATAASTEVTADGTVDFDAEQFQASARLALGDLAALSELAGTPMAGTLRLDLAAEGGLLQPQGTLQVQGSELAVAGISADRLATSFDFAAREPLTAAPRGLQLSGTGQLEGLSVPEVDTLPADDLAWELDVFARADDAIDLNLLRLSAADAEVLVRGEVDPRTLAAAGQIDLRVESLARLTEPFGQPIGGSATLHADLVAAEQMREIQTKLAGGIDGLSGLPPGVAELLGKALDLAAMVVIRPESRLQVTDLALEGEALSLSGDLGMTLPDNRLDGGLSLRLPRLAALEPMLEQPIEGALDLDLRLAGSVAAPDLELAARTSDLVLADRAIEKLVLLATAQGPTTDTAGKVELAVSTSGIEATLSTLYQLQEQTLRLSDLALVAPRSRIEGALSIDLERTLVDGTLRGRLQELAALAPLLPMPLRGQVTLDASFSPQNAKQNVQLSLATRDLAGDFGSLGSLEANARVADAMGAQRLEASATARDFRQNDVSVAQLRLNVAGTREQLTVSGAVEGQAVEPFALDTRAQVALGEAIRVRLEQLSGRVAGKPVRLAGPAEITVGDEMRLSGLNLELAGARLTADASMGSQRVAVEAALEGLSLALLADFGAPPLTGTANASLQMSGPLGDPRGTAQLTITGLRSGEPAFADLPPGRLTANAELGQRRLRVDLRGEGITDKPIVLTAALPVVLQLEPFQFALPDGPIDGRFDAEVQLARIADIAGLDNDRLEGLLGAALTFAGTTTEPQLNGTISIANGIYENGTTGTVLRDLTLRATARQQLLTIEEFSANDGGSGRLSAEGTVSLDAAASFPVEVRVALRSARLVRTNEADATVSGDLEVDGSAAAANLSGTITVDRADIMLPDQVGPSVPTIQVEEVNFPANRAPANDTSAGTPFRLGLDVTVNLPGRVFVRGRGLESEWEGRIVAKGTAAEPRLTGTLQIRRGSFELLDKRFELRRGVITFTGQSPPDPSIEIEAVARTADITAIVRITGSAGNLTIRLASEPPLPQEEVLSRLMFNRSASSITPLQAVQLAAAVNQLRGGGPGVLDRLRNTLGVDTLDVGGGSQGGDGATVRAGKYLSDDVYVEAETGTADQSSRARVEVEILPNLSLQADTGADASSGVGLKWQFDY